MNTNLSTSYVALQTDRSRLSTRAERGWQVEQATASGSRRAFRFGSLSEMAAAIVTSVHQFVDPRGYAMKRFEANQPQDAGIVSVLEDLPIAQAPVGTMSVAEQLSGALTALPNLRPITSDAVDSPAVA